MDAEIKNFIDGITKKTGIRFSVYDANGDFVEGALTDSKTVPTAFEGIKSFTGINKTLFHIKYKGKVFIGCIEGSGEIEKNYAYLIGELAENSYFKESSLSREDFCKAILLGEIKHTQILRYIKKYSMKDMPAFIMAVEISDYEYDEVKTLLTNFGSDGLDFVVETGDCQLALVKFVENESEEYQSSTEYAEFVHQTIYEETGARVRISIGGTVKSIADLSVSFSQAMATVRMCKALKSTGAVHAFKEYMLIKMLEDLPKYKLSEYLETLMDEGAREVFSDDEMVTTAEEFLENSLNISETSRKLYLHRNTLTYRLDKIEKGTGLNIRKFSDAVTFRLIMILSKLVK